MRYIFAILVVLATLACRERYDLPQATPVTGYLVVEGIINTTGKTIINLSRTSQLAEQAMIPELNALVRIEGDNNAIYPLIDLDSGRYASEELDLDPSFKYRLYIKTQSGGEYVSDFKNALRTPAIDSLTWKRTNGGVEIYVNAYDPQNAVKHYKWDYEETWEFKSPHRAFLEWKYPQGGTQPLAADWIDPVRFQSDSSRLFCWQSDISRDILIGSTEKLSDNRLYAPVILHPKDGWKLSRLYSIKVVQTGLSQEAYEFYDKMKKNTESLGSVFDPQPSEIPGNIKSVANSAEPVIGYIDVSTQTEKRLFISVEELPDWNYYEPCRDSIVAKFSDTLIKYRDRGYVPIDDSETSPSRLYPGVKIALEHCVDCRTRGTNIKPPFWP